MLETWITKDGTELNISHMTTEHIKNCIGFVQSKIDNHYVRREDLLC